QTRGYRVVFIGDGLSDVEVAGVADFLYAKERLLKHCREHDISAVPFRTLKDVVEDLPENVGE
ncbi:MAG: phosphoserine phosphatase, partial [bacterium]